MFLCSRWGKTKSEIESIPYSEFDEHWSFWKDYKWGMTDDMLAISVTTQMASRIGSKLDTKPWQIKEWTLHRGYGFQAKYLIITPVSVVRSAMMSVFDAVKGLVSGR